MLFLDFTGIAHAWFGWMAKVQFLPAVLALNVVVILLLVALTLVFGRVYCSVICPLGVLQDFFAWVWRGITKAKNPYSYSKALSILRYGVLVIFIIAFIAGIGSVVSLLAPYSSYGRIASNLLQPLWLWGNNALAYFAERADSYTFYNVEVWLKSLLLLIVAIVTVIILFILAARNGRTYCNTICPVGTVLGFISKFSILKIVFNKEKCVGCTLCEKNCKASCVNYKEGKIDYSRCVSCMNCLNKCKHGALSYKFAYSKTKNTQSKENAVDASKRSFLTASAIALTATTLGAQEKKVDGGLAEIKDKAIPDRKTPITPPGSKGAKIFAQKCTACQLCISACPNQVLRPSTKFDTFMQPEASYEKGYCRVECKKCSEVCPTGAIELESLAQKTSTKIGHAVWVKKNCIPLTDNVSCGNCKRHCPTGAITMVPSVEGDKKSPKIPIINTERCIGCGACENLCPARPFTAIYVEGHVRHSEI
jgi:Polyferredoxin